MTHFNKNCKDTMIFLFKQEKKSGACTNWYKCNICGYKCEM